MVKVANQRLALQLFYLSTQKLSEARLCVLQKAIKRAVLITIPLKENANGCLKLEAWRLGSSAGCKCWLWTDHSREPWPL
jgi:hypothetical protein